MRRATDRPRGVHVYGRATTIDAERTRIPANKRAEYVRNVERIQQAARHGRPA